MLDTRTTPVSQGLHSLHGQRIIILGACCAFGRSLCRTLDGLGAQVIAVDEDGQSLAQLEAGMPLALKGAPESALRRIGKSWGETRLDAVLNLMALRHPHALDLNIAVLQGIVQGFMPALSECKGQIITVVARPDQPLDVASGAMAPALLSAQQSYAHALRRDGLSLNQINVSETAVAPARSAVLGLLARSVGPLSGAELRL